MLPPRGHDPSVGMTRRSAAHWTGAPGGRSWYEFESFFRDGYPRLAAQLHAIFGDAGRAHAAAQYAYGRAWRSWGQIARLDDPGAWLRGQATAELTRPGWRQRVDTSASEHNGHDPQTLAMLDALGRLPSAQRRAVVLADLARVSPEQTAREIGISRSDAAKLVTRARAGIGERLVVTGPRVGLDPDQRQSHGTTEAWVSRQLCALEHKLAPHVEGTVILDEIRTSDLYRRAGIGSVAALTMLAGIGTAVAVAVTAGTSSRAAYNPDPDQAQAAFPQHQSVPGGGSLSSAQPAAPPTPHGFSPPTSTPENRGNRGNGTRIIPVPASTAQTASPGTDNPHRNDARDSGRDSDRDFENDHGDTRRPRNDRADSSDDRGDDSDARLGWERSGRGSTDDRANHQPRSYDAPPDNSGTADRDAASPEANSEPMGPLPLRRTNGRPNASTPSGGLSTFGSDSTDSGGPDRPDNQPTPVTPQDQPNTTGPESMGSTSRSPEPGGNHVPDGYPGHGYPGGRQGRGYPGAGRYGSGHVGGTRNGGGRDSGGQHYGY